MKANMTRSRGQVYSVGNYLMTGKVLGKGHFARVEEATHRMIGKKVCSFLYFIHGLARFNYPTNRESCLNLRINTKV